MIEQSIIKVFIDDNELYDKYYPSLKLEYVRQNYPILYKCFQLSCSQEEFTSAFNAYQ